jgi:PKD repeat protein
VTLPDNGQSLRLTAVVTDSGAPAITWSKVSGPGVVTFADPALEDTSATFSTAGTYVIRCSATTAAGTGSADLAVNIAPSAAADPTLALRLKLDESSGTTASDSSGNNLHATATGGVAWLPDGGALTGAASFNGTDSHLAVADHPLLDNTAAFTLSYWFRANTLGNNTGHVAKRVTFDNQNSYGTFLGLDGKLTVDINSNNNRFTSTTTFNTGAWYHVAVVFDGSLASTERARLYVNGSLDKTATETSTSIPNHASTLHIGTLLAGSPVFDGLIDEVRFHRRALGAPEIAAIRNETGTHAPVVSAGPAPASVVNVPSLLAGSVTVDSGPPPTAVWSKLSGPGNVVFSNPASPATGVTFDQPGNYVLRLTAANSNGETFADLSDTVFATSLPPPVVSITRPSAPVFLADTAHSLRLTASVETGGVPGTPAFAWSKLSGPGTITFDDSTAADTSATFSAPGTYLIRGTATNAGGTATADATVTVATPATTSFRQGDDNYSHTATFLRGDSTAWNSGARDQFLVGRNDTAAKLFRGVFSFPLSGIPSGATLTNITLDLWTHPTDGGTGSVSTVELRELTATPVEGTGLGTTATDGAGTGATWNNRTQTTPWNTSGGDFTSTVLSSVLGFNATTTGELKTFLSSTAFLAAAQTAVATGSPLNLMLLAPATETGSTAGFARFASDDHATAGLRPLLTVTWNPAPAAVISPGPAPAATTGEPAMLAAAVSGATSTTWSLVSGPGGAVFENPSLASTQVTFSRPGAYLLELAATNSTTEVSRFVTVNVTANAAYFADWQSLTWPGETDPEITGMHQDPDQDGISNLLEWALHLDAKSADTFDPTLVIDVANLQFTYTRRKTAAGEAGFQVLWSDTLEDDWSSDQVSTELPVSETDTTRTVMVSVPATAAQRFLRVRVSAP